MGDEVDKFWEIKNSADGTEILIYGDIAERSWFDDDVTPKKFAKELEEAGDIKEITVRINSGGGDVFAAHAIGNILEQNKAYVTAVIDGLCASAATIIACHCDKVKAAADSTYMVHPVRMGLCGYMDADDLRKCQQALEAIRDNIITLYERKTGHSREEVAGWMDGTSWWTGKQAKENGFVDEIVEMPKKTQIENRGGILYVNSVDMHMLFSQAPKFVQDKITKKEEGGAEMEIKTLEELRASYKDLVSQAEEQARDAERQRIMDIEEMALPGSEEEAKDAKYTHPVSAQEYAIQAMKKQKEKGRGYLDAIRRDAEGSGANGVAGRGPKEEEDEFMDAIKALKK